jgi:hypothetical protein
MQACASSLFRFLASVCRSEVLQLNIISEKTWEKKEHLCVVKCVLF